MPNVVDEEVIVKEKEMSEESFGITPSYLMTLDEYKEKVTPILSEYRKFIAKNKQWFYNTNSYYGLNEVSVEELVEGILNGTYETNYRLSFYGEPNEEKIIQGFNKIKQRPSLTELYSTPIDLLQKKNEYLEKLKPFFSKKEFYDRVELPDEIKINKKSIRRAIDNGTYTKLIEANKITFDKVKEIASTVGINVPRTILPPKDKLKFEAIQEIKKATRELPVISRDKLDELINQIILDLKPLELEVFEKEKNRYLKLIQEYLNSSVVLSVLQSSLPFYGKIYNFKHEKQETKNSPKIVFIESLKADYLQEVNDFVSFYVESLKWKIIVSIVSNFQKVTIPIDKIEKISIEVGYQGFEGVYRFFFENGSRFDFRTKSIGAGGYNIQVYHFRFISNFENVILSDGSKGVANSYQIAQNFSRKNQ